MGSIMLIPFEDEVISVANIQAQPPGQVFNVEAELSLANVNLKLLLRTTVVLQQLLFWMKLLERKCCTSLEKKFMKFAVKNSACVARLVERPLILNLRSHKETLSLQNVEDELSGKIFNIQIKGYSQKLDATQKLTILSYLEKQDVIHKSMASRRSMFRCKSAQLNILVQGKRISKHGNEKSSHEKLKGCYVDALGSCSFAKLEDIFSYNSRAFSPASSTFAVLAAVLTCQTKHSGEHFALWGCSPSLTSIHLLGFYLFMIDQYLRFLQSRSYVHIVTTQDLHVILIKGDPQIPSMKDASVLSNLK
ncbi:hypothetical protein H5410_020282 [Solanum commersonii]|uniref:Uncharacterized protein n=1 Tax=Solanum commersonii TaxID=4109 RepID=A0A9J5Z803_SOLCO|nr:hypothetical protein H5410_020282 [Solanum commersonii]